MRIQEAVDHTCETGFATFFSRSRGMQWVKGETSGNTIQVLDVYVDCDRDALIYLSLPSDRVATLGPESCFFSSELEQEDKRALPTLFRLYETLEARRESAEEKSYTKSLLSRGSGTHWLQAARGSRGVGRRHSR